MDDDRNISTEATKEPDKDSLGFKLKTLLEGSCQNLDDLPVELQHEHEDWEKEFPNLIVVGTRIPIQSGLVNEKQQLRTSVATQLVKLHLWPEIKRILEMNLLNKRVTKEQRAKQTFNLPRINP